MTCPGLWMQTNKKAWDSSGFVSPAKTPSVFQHLEMKQSSQVNDTAQHMLHHLNALNDWNRSFYFLKRWSQGLNFLSLEPSITLCSFLKLQWYPSQALSHPYFLEVLFQSFPTHLSSCSFWPFSAYYASRTAFVDLTLNPSGETG